jgi:hypothetical protein
VTPHERGLALRRQTLFYAGGAAVANALQTVRDIGRTG